MAGRERRELRRLTVLLVHLLKCRYQPERKTSSWLATLGEQRSQIALQLEDSPSLRLRFVEYVEKAYASVIPRAAQETGLDDRAFPISNPYTMDEMLDVRFIPWSPLLCSTMHTVTQTRPTSRSPVRQSAGY